MAANISQYLSRRHKAHGGHGAIQEKNEEVKGKKGRE